jgi:hypothetical protein
VRPAQPRLTAALGRVIATLGGGRHCSRQCTLVYAPPAGRGCESSGIWAVSRGAGRSAGAGRPAGG